MTGPFGLRSRLRHPPTRLEAATITNWNWVRRLAPGLGKLPVFVGLDAAGRRSVMLSPRMHRPRELQRFLEATGLPVPEDLSERVPRGRVTKRWPRSAGVRQLLIFSVALTAPIVLLAAAALVLALLATSR